MLRQIAALALAAACLVGCATPESRIKKNPEAFASLAPDVQENVRQGKIDLGYSPAAVEIALGAPQRQYTRRTAEGDRMVWSYTSTYTTRDRQRVDARVRAYDSSGRSRIYSDSVWVDVDQTHEFEKLRIEFATNTVIAIETLDR